ncbi:hypothetical protein MK079_04850 [Candidatus Gracilibacteria bacterium]|nr:hypothetical protein [Candidatus Gracilibacteria bacterium]
MGGGDEEIKDAIEKSQLFHSKIKRELLSYFHLLSVHQKQNISEALVAEKVMLKTFLSSLKDIEVISFETLKGNIESLARKHRSLCEFKEKISDEQDIDTLLVKLEEI